MPRTLRLLGDKSSVWSSILLAFDLAAQRAIITMSDGALKASSRDSSLKQSIRETELNPPEPKPQDHVQTFEHEKRLVLKFDVRILPVLALMYLANALDKGNLGNAKTNGMEKDLHFKDGQYNTILSVFFVPYVIFSAPVAFVGKKFGPARVLPILMFIFGSMTLLEGKSINDAQERISEVGLPCDRPPDFVRSSAVPMLSPPPAGIRPDPCS